VDADRRADGRHEAQAHLTSLLVRAVRAAVEPALHSGGMTVGQARTFLEQNLRLTGDLAEAEIDRYLAYPTQAASYLAGAAEITDIAAQARTSDRLTHDALTSCGSLPLNLLRQATAGIQAPARTAATTCPAQSPDHSGLDVPQAEQGAGRDPRRFLPVPSCQPGPDAVR
jgi:hypothetical protein